MLMSQIDLGLPFHYHSLYSLIQKLTMSLLAGPPNDVDVADWSWPAVPLPQSVQPYPKSPESKETIMRRKSGKSWIPAVTPEKDQIVAEHTERLKTMRWGESLSEKENLGNRNRRKTLSEDLDISSKDNSANNFKRDSKNESLPIGDTKEDADQITTEDLWYLNKTLCLG